MRFICMLFLLAACSPVEPPAQEAPQETISPTIVPSVPYLSSDSCKTLILSQQPSLQVAAETPDRASPLDVKRYKDLYGLCAQDPKGYEKGEYMILEGLPKE